MIDRRFIFFNTLKQFEEKKLAGEILATSIVFIKDALTIWTHDTYFKCIVKSHNNNGNWTFGDEFPIVFENLQQTVEYVEMQEFLEFKQQVLDAISNSGSSLTEEEQTAIDKLIESQNPIKITLTVSPTISELGNSTECTLTWNITRGSAPIIPSSLSLKVGSGVAEQITPAASGSIKKTINATTKFTIYAKCAGKDYNASVTSTKTRNTYYGFAGDSAPDVSSLTNAGLITSIGAISGRHIENTVVGNHLWIVTPHTITMVATDAAFGFPIAMEHVQTANGLKYYKGSDAVGLSNLVYYIK